MASRYLRSRSSHQSDPYRRFVSATLSFEERATEEGHPEGRVSEYDRVMRQPQVSESNHFQEEDKTQVRKGMSRMLYGSLGIVLGSALGILSGSAIKANLEHWKNYQFAVNWITVPSELFLNALSSLVVPVVFTTLTVSIADLVILNHVQKQGKIQTFIFLTSTFITAIEGIIWGLLYQSFFRTSRAAESAQERLRKSNLAMFAVPCPNGQYLTMDTDADGSLICTTELTENGKFLGKDLTGVFLEDTGGTLEKNIKSTLFNAETFINDLVPQNVMGAFAADSLVSVCMLAILFGITAALFSLKQDTTGIDPEHERISGSSTRSSAKTREVTNSTRASSIGKTIASTGAVLQLVRQVNEMFLLIFSWVMAITPIAVIFLMADTMIQGEEEYHNLLNNMTFLVFMIMTAHVVHIFVVLPMLYFLIHFSSPFLYMRKMVPAMVYAFGSASSVTTLPVSSWCINSTKLLPRKSKHTLLNLGATINMHGMALYLPIAFIFMMRTMGYEYRLTWWTLTQLLFITIIACVGAAPVPNAGLLMSIALWHALVSSDYLPITMPYIVLIEWLEDRLQTSTNVMGDIMLTLIFAPLLETEEAETRDENSQPNASVSPRRFSSEKATDTVVEENDMDDPSTGEANYLD